MVLPRSWLEYSRAAHDSSINVESFCPMGVMIDRPSHRFKTLGDRKDE
jgi:hypothetical protein